MGTYDHLRSQFPEQVSLEQMYKICHMAKRSAKYLLDNGIVPCVDSGKKTCRYMIKIDDIIVYLESRARIGTQIPNGALTSRKSQHRFSFASIILNASNEVEVKHYFEFLYADFPDVVDTTDLVEMTGFHKSHLLKLLKSGEIEALNIDNTYFIPQSCVLNFVSSSHYLNSKSNSPKFLRILGGFEKWLTAKS